jgi:hypothetical protein
MKFSKQTINILQNYATISNNIRIYPGSELTILSPMQSIFAKATVPDQFPVDACIYDLNSFLALLSYMENQEVEFGENSLTISSNGSTFEYRYADPSVIIAPPAGKSIELDKHYTFNLTAAEVIMIKKAIGISNAESIIIKGDGTTATWEVAGKARTVTWKKTLGTTDQTFEAILEIQNFQILPADYAVAVSKKKFLHFASTSTEVPQYWLALDPKSTI